MSSSEKALLTKELETLEDKKAIEGFIEDAEIMGGHEDIIELAKKKIEAIEAKINNITPPVETSNNQTEQVSTLGGSNEVVAERVASVDEKIVEKDKEIKSVTAEAEEKIDEVKKEDKEVVGESYPVTFDYLGKHFAENRGTKEGGDVEYEITGKVMWMGKGDATKDGILTVPVKYNIYRGVNGDKTPIYKNSGEEGYNFANPQVINWKLFFDNDTKELYMIDDGVMGKHVIVSPEMNALMEEAYAKLKSQKEQSKNTA